MLPRKIYTDLDDLLSELDNESLVEDFDMDLLEEDDLALLHGPRFPQTPTPKAKPKPKAKTKPRAKKKSRVYDGIVTGSKEAISHANGKPTGARVHKPKAKK